MDAYRIAIELFGHMILFVLGIIIGNFSVISLLNITFAPSIFAKSIEVVQSALSGKVSSYLLSHSTKIDVNYNESWYRILVYKIIWINHPPFFI